MSLAFEDNLFVFLAVDLVHLLSNHMHGKVWRHAELAANEGLDESLLELSFREGISDVVDGGSASCGSICTSMLRTLHW